MDEGRLGNHAITAQVASPELRRRPVHVGLRVGADGLRVGADPVEDVTLLAPWAATTHLKDLRQVRETEYGACALGDGFLDVAWTIQTIVRGSPRGERVPFIIEVSRPGKPSVPTLRSTRR